MKRAAVLIAPLFAIAACNPSGRSAEQDRLEFVDAHARDPIALQDKFSIEADSACSADADAYLRSISQYDFQWDDDAKGWLASKFDKVSRTSPGDGLVTLISTKAKLSNGFGAFSHIRLYCLYDAKSGRALRHSLNGFEAVEPEPEATPSPEPQPMPGDGPTPAPSYPITPATAGASKADRAKMTAWMRWNEQCRGSYDASIYRDACDRRDELENALQSRGWCWAYDDDALSAADDEWHRCGIARPSQLGGKADEKGSATPPE